MVAAAFARLHGDDHHHDHGHDHSHDHGHHHDHSHDHGHHHHDHAHTHGLLFIENVGNLVCPAVWDLGEAAKVAILSVTEGEDKPLKYPDMFAAAALLLINKVDLLPHLNFDMQRCIEFARRVNPAIEIIPLSATSGEGMEAWLHWLDHQSGCHHEHAEPSAEAALRERVRQLEAELAQARAAAS
jgi:hydrogenase nickel incorporation protein HypB